MSSGWLRIALRALLVFVLGAAVVTFRVVFAGEREIERSTAALEAGDPALATEHARLAATWYAPGAPHVRVAYGRLLALAREAENRKSRDVALLAYRAIVTASTSTTWLIVPHEADASEARAAIARLESTAPRPIASATQPPGEVEKELAVALAQTPGPSRVWTVVLAASFVALAVGIAIVLRRALDETGRLHRGPAAAGAAIGLVGLAGYALALWLA
ncbi:MAG: hypothetical protein HOV80_20610 [Polyangiaceae bacterium]|nr:hypothetical protein [Polyangiaceae bacterium]